jgi:hypothetical protein
VGFDDFFGRIPDRNHQQLLHCNNQAAEPMTVAPAWAQNKAHLSHQA